MHEVYETLLGHMKNNPVLSKYMEGDVPEWGEIWTNALPYLSSGEKVMFQIGLAMYNGAGTARFSDIFLVDADNRQRILDALRLRLDGLNP